MHVTGRYSIFETSYAHSVYADYQVGNVRCQKVPVLRLIFDRSGKLCFPKLGDVKMFAGT